MWARSGFLGVVALALGGCEERVRECDGAVEVVVAVDAAQLDRAAAEMSVTAVVDGEADTRWFDVSYLTSGSTSLILDLDWPTAVELQVLVDVAYDGPGNGAEAGWLHGEGLIQVPPGDQGCHRLEIELDLEPDRDRDRVPDPADRCPDDPDTDQPDSDGDLVGDACDLCPEILGELAHDEDGDEIGDQCDPCPHIADAGEPLDGDEDGVGDACDPSPDVPGDVILFFTGFGDPADLAGLSELGVGTATVAGDAVELSTATTFALVALTNVGEQGRVATRSHRVVGGSSIIWGEGTVAWNTLPGTDLDGIVCMAEHDDIVLQSWPFFTLGGGSSAVANDNEIQFASILEGKVGSTNVAMSCTINAETDPLVQPAPGNGSPPGFGIFVAESTARFDYLFIVDQPL